MSQLATPTLKVDDIKVRDGFNARGGMEGEALGRLAESIGAHGVIEPVVVEFDNQEVPWLIAGHRRLAASKIAGKDRIPFVTYQGERPRQVSLIENFHREDLDPIDAALGLKAIAEEFDLTKPQLAAEVNMSTRWVSERLRLLDLPKGVQGYVADGTVPVAAERQLREVAEISPGIAEGVCIVARRRKVPASDFVRHFGELLQLTAEARLPEKPTMIDVRAVGVKDVVEDQKTRAELTERIAALNPHSPSTEPPVRLTEQEIDAARAARCLVEVTVDNGEWESTLAWITDKAVAADLLGLVVERHEAVARKRAEEQEAWRARSGGLNGATPEERKDERRVQREKAKAAAVAARSFNETLGINLINRRGKASRRQFGLARAKAVATLVLADNRELAASGLRLVLPQLKEVEIKSLKSGETREKVSHADTDQALSYLAARIEEAKTEGEVLELLTDALIAGQLADQAELPHSRRVPHPIRAEDAVVRLLATEMKSVKPRAVKPKAA